MVGFIIGVCFMSVFALIGCIIVYNGNGVWGAILAGPAGWLLLLVSAVWRLIDRQKYKRARAVLIDKYDRAWAVPSSKADAYIHVFDMHFPNSTTSPGWYQQLMNFEKEWPKWARGGFNSVNFRYTPKKIWKKFAATPDKEMVAEIKKFFAKTP